MKLILKNSFIEFHTNHFNVKTEKKYFFLNIYKTFLINFWVKDFYQGPYFFKKDTKKKIILHGKIKNDFHQYIIRRTKQKFIFTYKKIFFSENWSEWHTYPA